MKTIITSLALLASIAAQAALLLNPGAIPFPAPSPAVLGPLVASLSDTVTDDLGNFSATVTTDVHSGGSNPLGGLTFVYTVTNDPDGLPFNSDLLGLAVRLLPGYVPGVVDIDATLAPGVSPTVAILAGQTLGFLFGGGGIPDGGSSLQIVVGTSYPSYAASVGAVIDGTSEDAAVLVPVPEPVHGALLAALGLAGFALFRRQRRTVLASALALTVCCLPGSVLGQVYSVNTVGYVVRELQAGFNLMATPMDFQENRVQDIYPNVPDGTQIATYSPATGYSIITFDGGEWLPSGDTKIPPGTGHWVRVRERIFHVYVGTVRQGDLSTPLVAGVNLVASQVPQEGLITEDLWYRPSEGDQALQYRPDRGYTTFTYDSGEWLPAQPYLAIAEGVWIRRSAPGFWQRSFSVNP